MYLLFNGRRLWSRLADNRGAEFRSNDDLEAEVVQVQGDSARHPAVRSRASRQVCMYI